MTKIQVNPEVFNYLSKNGAIDCFEDVSGNECMIIEGVIVVKSTTESYVLSKIKDETTSGN